MKVYGLTLIILTCFSAFSQEPETIQIKLKKESEGGYKYKIEYFALKSDTSIKHGEYKRYNILKDLEESGYYNHGIKESIWKTYSAGKMVNSVGIYKNGKKEGLWNYYTNIHRSWKPTQSKTGYYLNDSIDGVWTYYYRSGDIEQKYDHTNDSLVYHSPNYDKKKYLIRENNEEKIKELDTSPMLIGGDISRSENWQKMDHQKLSSLSNDSKDVSYSFSFWIKPNGETHDYKMINSVNTEFDSYIIEFYKENYHWVAGTISDKNVECKVIISDGYIVKM